MSDNNEFGIRVPEGMVWTYRITVCGNGGPEHMWTLKSEHGGIHVSAWISQAWGNLPAKWLGGIECHTPPSESQSPSHDNCWLLEGPCHHDGSSLQFCEQIAPELPYAGGTSPNKMNNHHHAYVLSVMLNRHRVWIVEQLEQHTEDCNIHYGNLCNCRVDGEGGV